MHSLTLGLCGVCVQADQEVCWGGSERYSELRWPGSSYISWGRSGQWATPVSDPGESAVPPAHTLSETFSLHKRRSCTLTITAKQKRGVTTDGEQQSFANSTNLTQEESVSRMKLSILLYTAKLSHYTRLEEDRLLGLSPHAHARAKRVNWMPYINTWSAGVK